MKIITKQIAEPPKETGQFNNGDLYIPRKKYQSGDRKTIFLCSCGMLIRLPDCNSQHSIEQQAIRRTDYVNVTTKFSVILNEYFEEQEATIQELSENKRKLLDEINRLEVQISDLIKGGE